MFVAYTPIWSPSQNRRRTAAKEYETSPVGRKSGGRQLRGDLESWSEMGRPESTYTHIESLKYIRKDSESARLLEKRVLPSATL